MVNRLGEPKGSLPIRLLAHQADTFCYHIDLYKERTIGLGKILAGLDARKYAGHVSDW